MSLISIEIREAAAILKLNREITNAINHQLVDELAGALREFGPDQAVRSLVLTSNNEKFFSIGLDIPQLYDLPLQEFKHFYHNFNQVCIDLLTFPKPTIAAIPGHAIAGGCILALCCDYRIIAAGRRLMGLNEVKLGVAVPYPAACVLSHIVGYRNAREMMYTGNFYTPEESYSIGLVDEVVPLEYVRSRSIEKATVLSAGSAQAIAQIKWGLVEPICTQIERHIQEKEDYFIERWYADDTRISLKEAMEKF